MKHILNLLIIYALFLSSVTKTQAANYGLSINPPLVKVNIKPGKTITQVFTITNLANEDKLVVARIIPFTQADTQGNPQIDLKSNPTWLDYFSLTNSHIKLQTPFTIKSRASEQLVISLSIPDTVVLRDIYASLLVSTYSNSINSNLPGSQVSATIGSNLLITIHPDIDPPTLLKISHLSPSSGSFFRIGEYYFVDNITPISFSATAKNDGNFISETKGMLKITNSHNQAIYLEGLLPQYVLSGTSRQLQSSNNQSLTFKPNLTTIGFHQANIQIKSANANTESSLNLFFFPFKLTLGLLVTLALLSFAIRNYQTTPHD